MASICFFYLLMKESQAIEMTHQKQLKGMKYRFTPALPLAHSLSLSGPSTVNIIVCSIQTFNSVSFTIPLLQYGLPLKIVSYKDLYGWTMDDIVKAIGLKNNCTFCGVFRRQVVPTCKSCTEISFLIFNQTPPSLIILFSVGTRSRCCSPKG